VSLLPLSLRTISPYLFEYDRWGRYSYNSCAVGLDLNPHVLAHLVCSANLQYPPNNSPPSSPLIAPLPPLNPLISTPNSDTPFGRIPNRLNHSSGTNEYRSRVEIWELARRSWISIGWVWRTCGCSGFS